MEKIALGRLQWAFERIGAYSVDQYAFTAGRDRNDLVAKIIESVLRYRLNSKYGQKRNTHLVKLDIKDAFDSVNQDVLINRLLTELGSDPIRFWVANYLLERKLRLEYKNIKTRSRQVCRGVPQGSSLGPILWNFAINRIHEGVTIEHKSDLLIYADDLFYIYNGNISREFNTGLGKLVENLGKLDLELTTKKCKRLVLSKGAHQENLRSAIGFSGFFLADSFSLILGSSKTLFVCPFFARFPQ